MQVLFVVVVPPVRQYLSHSEEPAEILEARDTSRTLRHREFGRHLIAGLIAFSTRPIGLPDEAEREASFSVYKTNNPAELYQPFLLIACTHRIVTSVSNYHTITIHW